MAVEAFKETVNDDGLAMAEEGKPPEQAPLDKPSRRCRYGAAALVAVAILLAVGLSVGLTVGRSDNTQDVDDTTGTDNTAGNNTNNTITTGTNNTAGSNNTVTTGEENVYNSTRGPLEASIPLFGSNIARGYSNRTELEESLTGVGNFLANNVINRNLQVPGYEHTALPMVVDTVTDGGPLPAAPGEFASETEGATSFETNNQEKGVDEGDRVKSDGTFVYTAYGDKVVVLNVTSGQVVTEVQMPSIDVYNSVIPEDAPVEGGATGSSSTTKSVPYYLMGVNVESLLLTSNRLVVVASGYGHILQQELAMPPILTDYASTHVRLYDTSFLSVSAPSKPELKVSIE